MRKYRIGLPLCLLGLALAAPAFAGPPDEKLRAMSDAAKPELIETLRQMVSIESGSSDLDGLAKIADFTEGRLKALGAKVERRKTARGAGADIVIGTFEGTGHAKLMLMAHMDTVYERGILASQPWRVDGERIYGPGIADDKGGIAVVLHALKILKEVEWRNYAKLTVLFNPDEEVGSIGSGELISEIADQHDQAQDGPVHRSLAQRPALCRPHDGERLLGCAAAMARPTMRTGRRMLKCQALPFCKPRRKFSCAQ